MRKITAVLLAMLIGLFSQPLAQNNRTATGIRDHSENNSKEIKMIDPNKTLIVFFSRADENYAVGNIEKGNTRIIGMQQRKV